MTAASGAGRAFDAVAPPAAARPATGARPSCSCRARRVSIEGESRAAAGRRARPGARATTRRRRRSPTSWPRSPRRHARSRPRPSRSTSQLVAHRIERPRRPVAQPAASWSAPTSPRSTRSRRRPLQPVDGAPPGPERPGRGEARFVMSLRAVGEGHRSSIEFRTGVVDAGGERATSTSRRGSPVNGRPGRATLTARSVPPRSLRSSATTARARRSCSDTLPDPFTGDDLDRALRALHDQLVDHGAARPRPSTGSDGSRASNYEVSFPPDRRCPSGCLVPTAPSREPRHGGRPLRAVRRRRRHRHLLRDLHGVRRRARRAAAPGDRRLPDVHAARQLTGRAAARTRAWRCSRAASTAGTSPCRGGIGRPTPSSTSPTTRRSGTTPVSLQRPGERVGAHPARQLRIADRDAGRLARAHPRRRTDAHATRSAPCCSTSTTRPASSATCASRCSTPTRGRARRLRPERRLLLRSDPARRHHRAPVRHLRRATSASPPSPSISCSTG